MKRPSKRNPPLAQARVERIVTRRQPTADGRGYISVPDHKLSADAAVYVDGERLARVLGTRALHGVTHVATMLDGAIVAEVSNIVRAPVQDGGQ